jgi:pilus assembly protein FimV
LLGSLVDSVLQFWWVLAGLLALVAGYFGYRRWQSRRAFDIEDTFGGTTTTAAAGEMSVPPPAAAADTARLRRPNLAGSDKSGFVVEESGEFEAPRLGASTAAAAVAGKSVAADDTLSGETGINLDQGDPLAEADFHMAYGLYDQAADLVRLAVAREPDRRDLKLKLAEVYFVWGNRDEFLKTARGLHETLGEGAAGEWDKIVIMGKQIAPEDPLFSQATARAASSGLDLQLDGGAQPLDFDVFGDGSGSTQTIESVSNSDLDFGPVRRGDVDPTIERPGPASAGPDAPTVMVEAGGGTTREMAPQFSEAPTAESPRLDVDLDELLASARTENSDSPTVEQPGLRAGGPNIRAKLDAALKQTAAAGDQTAELAIDDLGLDLGDLEKLGDLDVAGAEASHAREEHGAAADAPTMLASFDEEAQKLIEKAARRGNGRDTAIDPAATAAMETLRVDTSGFERASDPGATSMVAALDTTHLDSDDFDLDKLGASGVHKVDGGIDLDIGQSTLPGQGGRGNGVSLPALEPVTISEVGTKLDLARAYMDMGDPDGARNILREVLAEGSVSQKQEANRLLESLPG